MPFSALFKTPDRRNFRLLAALVSLVTLVVYLPALRNGFVNWDDYAYIVGNIHIRSLSWTNLKWLFTDASIDYWHPLSMLSHALDYALWGSNPVGHHLTSILLHAANTFLVVCLIAKLLESAAGGCAVIAQPDSDARPEGFLGEHGILITATTTGALFGLHPLHVESVAWVTERKDVLCGFFFLLAILTYANYVNARERSQKTRRSYYIATVILFVLALSSKAMAVTLPAVLLILDWYPFRRICSWRQLVTATVEKAPFIVFSIIISILTFSVHNEARAVVSYAVIPPADRVFIAFRALGVYLWKMAVPLNLLPFYAYPRNISGTSIEYLAAVIFVFVTTFWCLLSARRHPLFLAAWAYYTVMLIPVLGIVQVAGYSMADRFTYLPSLGPFVALGLLSAWGWNSLFPLEPNGAAIRRVVPAIAIILVLALSSLTIRQIAIWNSSLTLWAYTIERSPDPVPLAYLNRGVAFAELGQREKALEDIDQAILLAPAGADGYRERGILFGEMGQYDRAVTDLSQAIILDPSDASSYNNRGIALEYLGQLDRSLADYDKAIALHPGDSSFYRNRGIALGKAGRLSGAIDELSKSISLAPEADAYFTRGDLYQQSNRPDLAARDYQTACSLGSAEGCNAIAAGIR